MFVGASRAEAFGREQVDDVRFVIQSSSESHQRRVGLVEVVYNNNVTAIVVESEYLRHHST